MVDKIIIRNTDSETKIGGVQATDVLNGEMLLVREVDKERLYCKNSDGEISKIHRVTNCGEFESEKDYVDLGLPSGLLWAKKNIGAATEEDAGLYFQWGDVQGYTAEQVGVDKQFNGDYSDYKWHISGSVTNLSKYTGSNGDGLTTLEAIDDAAIQIMGSEWRMPTREDFKELISNTNIYIINNNNEEISNENDGSFYDYAYISFPEQESIKGVKIYSKIDNTKYLYFPAVGGALNGKISYYNDRILLWTNLVSFNSGTGGYDSANLYNITNSASPNGYGRLTQYSRSYGLTIRAVKPVQ